MWPGRFFNGKTARPWLCLVDLLPDRILIRIQEPGENEPEIVSWDLSGIHRNDLNDRSRVILKYGQYPFQVLEVTEKGFLEVLQEYYPDSEPVKSHYGFLHWMTPGKLLALAATFLTLVVLGYFVGLPLAGDLAAKVLPRSLETQLGSAVRDQFMAGQEKDSVLSLYAQEYYDRLGLQSPYQIQVTVVDDSIRNAFALPGGQIVLFTGILEMMVDHRELAGLLAHESTHVSERHSLRAIMRNVAGLWLISLVFGDVSGAGALIVQNAHSLRTLQYSRSFEKEADMRGLRQLEQAGVDPSGMVTLFRTLQQEEGLAGRVPELLSTHPHTAERMKYLDEAIDKGKRDFAPRPDLEHSWKNLSAALRKTH